jgi:endoglycosylceramidase
VRPLIALAVVAAACGPSGEAPECPIARPLLPDWRLRADGPTLRDALGRAVMLRGVNAGGRSKFAPFSPFDFSAAPFDAALAAYLDRAASWGATVLRVPFTWAAVEPAAGADDAEFLGRYDALLDGAWARGLRTVVDFHQDVYAENLCGDGFPAWTLPDPKPAPHHDCPTWYLGYGTPPVDGAFDRFWAAGSTVRTAYDALWDRLVARYRDRAGVIGFELFNEPWPGSANLAAFEAGTLTQFYSDEVARLRPAAPDALFFFDPPGVDSATATTALARPSGDGLVFAPHYYQATTLTPAGDGNPDTVAAAVQSWLAYGAKWNVPVFLGEFGAGHAGDNAADYVAAHFAALDAAGMSGTEWEYSVAAEAWNAEAFGLTAADGTEFPVAQAIIRPSVRAVAGTGVVAAFDPAVRKFSLDWVADGGVTEVALPARFAPSPRVRLHGGGCVDRSQPNLLLVTAAAGRALALEIAPR